MTTITIEAPTLAEAQQIVRDITNTGTGDRVCRTTIQRLENSCTITLTLTEKE